MAPSLYFRTYNVFLRQVGSMHLKLAISILLALIPYSNLIGDPLPSMGFIDLSSLDLKKNVDLSQGEWLFWQERFITGNQLRENPSLLDDAKPILAGSSWTNDPKYKGRENSYGTFYLRIKLPQSKENKALYFKGFAAASEIEILENGQIISSGKPGKSVFEETLWWVRTVFPISNLSNSTTITLLVRVSNFDFRNGGLDDELLLGTFDALETFNENRIKVDHVLIGILLVFFLYHFQIFLLRREDKASFFFSIFAVSMLLRKLTIGRYVENGVGFEGNNFISAFIPMVEYSSVAISCFSFIFYQASILGLNLQRPSLKIHKYFSLGIVALIIMAPSNLVRSSLLTLFQALAVWTVILGFWIFLQKFKILEKGDRATFYTVFSVTIFATFAVIHDVTLSYIPSLTFSFYISEYAAALFFIAQSFTISYQYSLVFQEKRHALKELSKLVYPHQLLAIKNGEKLETTMPIGWTKACVLMFDIVGSSKITHSNKKAFLDKVLKVCGSIMNEGYNPEKRSAKAYRIKEMGDGFLCSIGFPFSSNDSNTADCSVELAKQFILEFRGVVAEYFDDQPQFCSIGIAFGDIESGFASTGIRNYDLYGDGIVLATRYEKMRNLLMKKYGVGNYIIISDTIQKLCEDTKDEFTKVDLKELKWIVRDDERQNTLYFQKFSNQDAIVIEAA